MHRRGRNNNYYSPFSISFNPCHISTLPPLVVFRVRSIDRLFDFRHPKIIIWGVAIFFIFFIAYYSIGIYVYKFTRIVILQLTICHTRTQVIIQCQRDYFLPPHCSQMTTTIVRKSNFKNPVFILLIHILAKRITCNSLRTEFVQKILSSFKSKKFYNYHSSYRNSTCI